MDVSEICELIDGIVGRMDRETTGSTLLRCGDMEKHTDTGYAWDGVLFLAEALKREVMARGYGRMSEFRWHLMADEVPKEGKGRYILMGHRGAFYYADRYDVGPGGSDFHIPNNRSGYIGVESVKAWTEIPPMEVDE